MLLLKKGCNKYDVVKAVTLKLLRISKNPALFWSFENENYYYIIEKKNQFFLKQSAPVSVRITLFSSEIIIELLKLCWVRA